MIDANLTEGTIFSFQTIIASIQVFLTPPIVYWIAIGLAAFSLGIVWEFLRPDNPSLSQQTMFSDWNEYSRDLYEYGYRDEDGEFVNDHWDELEYLDDLQIDDWEEEIDYYYRD